MTSGVKYAKQVTFGTDLIRYATDPRWYHTAVSQLDLLLIDHAHCEKKAASFAMGMIYRYVDRADLLALLSPLVREEMLHFEQVMGLLKARHITYRSLPAARYTRLLLGQVCQTEPNKLLDTLLIAALIEARSCERFLGLSRILPVPRVHACVHVLV